MLLSLLLAFSVWFIHNLGQVYISEVTVPVKAFCSLDGRAGSSSNTPEVTAICKASGFNHVRLGWYIRNHTRKLHLDASQLHRGEGEMFYLTDRELQEISHSIFGESFVTDHFITDTLFFRFPEENCRKVPVEFVGDLSCKPQYTFSEGIVLDPDSVVVFGEPSVLDAIRSVRTESVIRMDVSKDLKGSVGIRPVKDVRLSVGSVRYRAKVQRCVELTQSYHLKVRNIPEGRELVVLPSEVKVSFICPFPLESDPREQAVFYVDYADFEASYRGRCMVRIDREPDGVLRWTSDPEMVECVVRE